MEEEVEALPCMEMNSVEGNKSRTSGITIANSIEPYVMSAYGKRNPGL